MWSISIAALCTSLLVCVVPSDAPRKSFHFDHAVCCDTIAPYGTMTIGFTEPVADSSPVQLLFNPPFLSYTVEFTSERDSVMVRFSEPLSGGTDYTVHLHKTIYSIHRSVFNPEDDSLLISTATAEQEPNDRIAIADTLFGRCFGSIAMVNDTDWFVVTSTVRKVYCNASGSRTSFFISGMHNAGEPREYSDRDTVSIPDTASTPLLIAVHAYNRSVGGYYELGYIRERENANK